MAEGPDSHELHRDGGTPRGPGERLRAERERIGLALEEVARELHMDTGTLEQLEHDNYDRLSVPIFVKGHLRNYARLLSLPADELVEAYEQIALPRVPELVPLRPEGPRLQNRAGWWTAIVGGVLVVALLGLTVVWWEHRPAAVPVRAGAPPHPVAAATSRAEAAESGTPSSAVSSSPPGTAASVHKPAGGDVAGSGTAAGENPGKDETAEPAGRASAPPASEKRASDSQSAAASAPSDSTHLVLNVRAASWIEVYDGTGKRLYYDLAATGATLRLSGVAPLRVFLGNSPGVVISVNGKPFDQSPFQRGDNTARFQVGTADSGKTQ